MKTPPKRTPSALRQYLIEQGHTELLDETEDEAIHKPRVSSAPPQEVRSARRERRRFSVIASPLSRKSLAKFLERSPALQKSAERKREVDELPWHLLLEGKVFHRPDNPLFREVRPPRSFVCQAILNWRKLADMSEVPAGKDIVPAVEEETPPSCYTSPEHL
jgi:hypothetical protein